MTVTEGLVACGLGVETTDPEDWVAELNGHGAVRDQAIRQLHGLMARAAGRYVATSVLAASLGAATRDDIVQSSADEATMEVLRKLPTFEHRSKFTTWAYKFAVLKVAVEVRRAAWRTRDVDLLAVGEPPDPAASPHDHAVSSALSRALKQSIESQLTPHQRRVLVAIVIDGVPIDVVADRIGSTRNAVYKTLHDARKRLRQDLVAQGLIESSSSKDTPR